MTRLENNIKGKYLLQGFRHIYSYILINLMEGNGILFINKELYMCIAGGGLSAFVSIGD